MKRQVPFVMQFVLLLMAFSANAAPLQKLQLLESENQVEVTNLYPLLPQSTRVFETVVSNTPNNVGEDDQTYQIRVNFQYDSENYKPRLITLFNENYVDRGFIRGENDFYDFNAPSGIYDIICVFTNLNPEANSPTSPLNTIVIIEGIDVKSDMEVTANPNTAVNLIEFTSYNPDGSLSVLPLDSQENENETHATVDMIYYSTEIISKATGFAWGSVILTYSTDFLQYPDRIANVMVNDLSDNYYITQKRILSPIAEEPSLAYVEMTAPKITSCKVSNNYSDYINVKSNELMDLFIPTPAYSESNVKEGYKWLVNSYEYNEYSRGGLWSVYNQLPDFYFDTPFDDDLSNIMVSITGIENHYINSFEDSVWEGITSPCLFQKNGQLEFTMEPFIGKREEYQAGEEALWNATFNPYAEITFSLDKVRFGESAPWAFFTNQEVDYSEWSGIDYRELHGIFISYIGKYGEVRDIDNSRMTVNVYYNGEKIRTFTDNDSFISWCYEWLMSGEELGELKYEITNENIEVEGLKGKNYIEAALDERNEECTIPALQYVGFTDLEGKYTNSFESGKIELFAGDFDIILRDVWETSPKPAYYSVFSPLKSMKVEYAPYGSDDFTELNVEMIPGAVWHPFGQCYSAEIAGLSEGWYDIRVTMEDEAGNWQKQTISPAFKILDSSSVGITTYDTETTPTYYNLQGVRIDKPENGIFIERTGNSVRKVVK